MIKKYTFSKKEHLCGEIRVNNLFTEGKAFIVYPIRVVYKIVYSNKAEPVKVLVSVPKKRFKHAVNRNRIKRLLREAYRLNKSGFVEQARSKCASVQIAINYVGDAEFDFESLSSKMNKALDRISEKL